MNSIVETVRPFGELLGAPYHDGIVQEVHAGIDTFSLVVNASEGRTEIKIHGVWEFGIAPLRKNAILSNVTVFPQDKWDELSSEPDGPWATLAGQQILRRDYHYLQSRLCAHGDDVRLLVFDLSYGGAIVVAGKSGVAKTLNGQTRSVAVDAVPAPGP